MYKRVIDEPKNSYFLFGIRGIGKSCWLRENYNNAYFIDFLNSETLRLYLSKPERLINVVDGILQTSSVRTIVLDEIQKVPQILDSIHFLMNRNPDLQFIMTGSSARKIKREKDVNLLGGRAVYKKMHPFMACELEKDFSFDKALQYGLIPLIWQNADARDALNAYINLYMEEEIKAEGFVRNLSNFSRFLEAVSFSHGSLLNVTNIAQDCQVKRTTVAGYIDILQDMLLGYAIPSFKERPDRKTFLQDKFYFTDIGIYRILRPTGSLDNPGEIEGAALEGLIAQHLRAWCDYSNYGAKLYYWRTYSGQEVDFIIYGPKIFVAIEVKNSTSIKNQDLSGLKSFGSSYPEAKKILLYRGTETQVVDSILCMPCEAFLRCLHPNENIME